MLIDAEMTADGALAMPGIGINVNGDPTRNPELTAIATSVARELGRPVERERLLARVCNELEVVMELPPQDLLLRYRAMSIVLGRRVVVRPAVGDYYEATALEVADDGSLVVVRDNGASEQVNAADVSLRPM
jgi:BirA family transcriptional regulator, biotin operon repressor / biotin---[acetyl-CoA-carboxylase] ligase